jgi:hypothetical protein
VQSIPTVKDAKRVIVKRARPDSSRRLVAKVNPQRKESTLTVSAVTIKKIKPCISFSSAAIQNFVLKSSFGAKNVPLFLQYMEEIEKKCRKLGKCSVNALTKKWF